MDLKNLDIKEEINKIVDKAKGDGNFMAKLKENPVKAVEETIGIDLPDDVITKIVEGVKAKINLDKLSGLADGLKKLF